MPSEPEREIEKQLQAYAKKRRQDAGAPLELHPVTRRMLQDEVAALKPANPAGGSKKTWTVFWPRLAMAGFLFTMLGIGTWALLLNHPHSKTSFELAKTGRLKQTKTRWHLPKRPRLPRLEWHNARHPLPRCRPPMRSQRAAEPVSKKRMRQVRMQFPGRRRRTKQSPCRTLGLF